jgi:hypothetical protein
MLNKFTKILFSAQQLQSFFGGGLGGGGGEGVETYLILLMYSLGLSFEGLET